MGCKCPFSLQCYKTHMFFIPGIIKRDDCHACWPGICIVLNVFGVLDVVAIHIIFHDTLAILGCPEVKNSDYLYVYHYYSSINFLSPFWVPPPPLRDVRHLIFGNPLYDCIQKLHHPQDLNNSDTCRTEFKNAKISISLHALLILGYSGNV